jgi:hypothetical protein
LLQIMVMTNVYSVYAEAKYNVATGAK